jgi:hypothetical protein
MLHDAEPPPDRCELSHQVFTSLGDVLFRRAETDGTPVMIIMLGEREAAVPLRALQREFSIGDDTQDGRMLGLIAESLDFVPGLHLGDPLPSEVVSGAASWEPAPEHREVAQGRLKAHLIAWVAPGVENAHLEGVASGDAKAARKLDEDPSLRMQVQAAFSRAAVALGLAGPADVVSKLEELADELAYIEALRDLLLRRVQGVVARLQRIQPNGRSDVGRNGTLTQVQRLIVIALRQIGQRFAEVDAQTAEVTAALRNLESQQAFIRSNRDSLYRSLRAWDPFLKDWARAHGPDEDGFWTLLARFYTFLAARYMPFQEWQTARAPRARAKAKPERVMSW